MTQSTEEVLSERNTTHGDFGENARISQSIKALYRSCPGWAALTDAQKEAMEMNALKDSRILSGQPDFKDHWVDKSGYSALAAKDCTR